MWKLSPIYLPSAAARRRAGRWGAGPGGVVDSRDHRHPSGFPAAEAATPPPLREPPARPLASPVPRRAAEAIGGIRRRLCERVSPRVGAARAVRRTRFASQRKGMLGAGGAGERGHLGKKRNRSIRLVREGGSCKIKTRETASSPGPAADGEPAGCGRGRPRRQPCAQPPGTDRPLGMGRCLSARLGRGRVFSLRDAAGPSGAGSAASKYNSN